MVIKIIGLLIGILILGAGIYYLAKYRQDAESRKIYTVFCIIGGMICVISALLLLFS